MNGKTILIVDDDMDFVRALNIRLRANGYQVTFASDGYSALTKARKEEPDLILLDLGLPAGDGFAVMERLRSLVSSVALIPIIVLTAREPMTNKERSLAAGAEAFLQKPVDNDILLATIREALGESTPKLPSREWTLTR
jgi:DNA-binding response OmpR family regulator